MTNRRRAEESSGGVRVARRRFLTGAAAGLAMGACESSELARNRAGQPSPVAPEPPAPSPYPSGVNEEAFVVHGARPLTMETKRGAVGTGVITPTDRFFVRNNLPRPSEAILRDRGGWTLKVSGVSDPRSVTVRDLMRLGFDTLTTVLQCSGNGRKFFEHGPSGSPWATGAAGCAIWSGVPVRALVAALGGVVEGARFMTSTGGEELPDGVDPHQLRVERSIPVEKALEDCLLAWEMNGEPLSLAHGGPLRLIVPGYYGCNNIKYVASLAFGEAQSPAKIQQTGYRIRPVGRDGDPSQPPMWRMNVKSWLTGPGADGEAVLAGPIVFHGVTFSGGSAIRRVEYSLDGRTWKPARFVGPDLGPYAWRQFSFTETLTKGQHSVFTRAVDTAGEQQPEHRLENERGYGNNSWRDHGLTLNVVNALPERPSAAPGLDPMQRSPAADDAGVAREPIALDESAARGRHALLHQAEPPCGVCHTLDDAGIRGAVGPNLNVLEPDAARVRAALENGVGAMPPYEGRLPKQTLNDIAHYVEMATKKH